MKRSEVLLGVLRIPLDALAVAAALMLSYRLRLAAVDLVPWRQLLEPAQTLPSPPAYVWTFILPSVGAFFLISAFLGLYSLQSTRSAWREFGHILVASIVWLVAVIGWFFLVRKQLFYSRILLVHSTVFIALFVAIVRSIVVLLQRRLLRHGIGVRFVVSIGSQRIPKDAERTLTGDPRYRTLGHVRDLSGLRALMEKSPVDLVLQTDPNPESDETVQLINHCRSHHIGYAFFPPVLADVPHQLKVEPLGLLPMIRFQPTPLDGWGRVSKRLFDLCLCLILLVPLLPILLLIALAVLIDGGWPVLYVSRRVGESGRKSISMLKFRSMVRDADARKHELLEKNERKDGPLFKLRDDPRITRIGRVLRRYDLDELPQIFNVLAGQMSLVGPRPHLPAEVKLYSDEQRRVFAVKPGITGLAQVSGRSDLTFDQEALLDLRYVEEWSLFLDLWILWRTIPVVLSGRFRG